MTGFRERWRVPALWWVVGVGLSVGAAAEISGRPTGGWSLVPYLVLPLATVLFLGALSRGEVVVEDGLLHVPGARAPLTAFGPPEVLDREQLRQWRGPRAQRDAWVRVPSWSSAAVRLPVDDADDDTPYWLIASRRPEELARACRR